MHFHDKNVAAFGISRLSMNVCTIWTLVVQKMPSVCGDVETILTAISFIYALSHAIFLLRFDKASCFILDKY